MKKILFLSFAFLLFAGYTQAQANNRQPQKMSKNWNSPKAKMHRAELMKQLHLTPEQQTQLKAIGQTGRKQREEIKNNNSLTQEQKKEAFRKLMKDNMAERNAVYTPEQKAILKKDREARMKHFKDRKMHQQAAKQ